MNFSERIKTQRKNLGMTQADVAKKLFVTWQTVSSWENGKSYPDLNMLVKISDVYDVPVDSLLKEDTELKKHLNRKEATFAFSIYGDMAQLVLGLYCLDQYWLLKYQHVYDNSIWSTLIFTLMLVLSLYSVHKMPMFNGREKGVINDTASWPISYKIGTALITIGICAITFIAATKGKAAVNLTLGIICCLVSAASIANDFWVRYRQ